MSTNNNSSNIYQDRNKSNRSQNCSEFQTKYISHYLKLQLWSVPTVQMTTNKPGELNVWALCVITQGTTYNSASPLSIYLDSQVEKSVRCGSISGFFKKIGKNCNGNGNIYYAKYACQKPIRM